MHTFILPAIEIVTQSFFISKRQIQLFYQRIYTLKCGTEHLGTRFLLDIYACFFRVKRAVKKSKAVFAQTDKSKDWNSFK